MSEKIKLLYKIEAFDSDYDIDRPDKCIANIGGEQGKAYFNYDYKKHRYLVAFISDDFDVYDNIATKEKEIERLNNIINELEKELDRLLERQYESEKFAKEQGFDTYLPAKENLLCLKNKLQELKDNDKE